MLLLIVGAPALVLLTAAGTFADKPTTVIPIGTSLPVFDSGFSPRALPKTGRPAPLTWLSGVDLGPLMTAAPSVLDEVVLELDRHVTVDAAGMGVCRPGRTDEPPPSERCRDELVGRGKMTVEIAFPEQEAITEKVPVLAYNGGIKDGTMTIYVRGSLSFPVLASVVVTIEVTRIQKGRYGTRWVQTIPRIAGGAGSLVDLRLKLGKRYRDRDEERSFLLGRCPDRHLNARATSVFADGTVQRGTVIRSCVPKR